MLKVFQIYVLSSISSLFSLFTFLWCLAFFSFFCTFKMSLTILGLGPQTLHISQSRTDDSLIEAGFSQIPSEQFRTLLKGERRTFFVFIKGNFISPYYLMGNSSPFRFPNIKLLPFTLLVFLLCGWDHGSADRKHFIVKNVTKIR